MKETKAEKTTLRQRRESTDDKAVRLLTTGKLRIIRMDPTFVHAKCKGDTEEYDMFFSEGKWYCSCKARTDCSHMRALWMVTVDVAEGKGPWLPKW